MLRDLSSLLHELGPRHSTTWLPVKQSLDISSLAPCKAGSRYSAAWLPAKRSLGTQQLGFLQVYPTSSSHLMSKLGLRQARQGQGAIRVRDSARVRFGGEMVYVNKF